MGEVVEQIVETILRIQLQNRTPTIPTLSAMQLKLESWIKFHGVKYENVQDKEVIAEEEKELIENAEKKDEPEKTEEVKDENEEKTEPKKVHLLQKLFGKRKDFVVPKIDEVAKTDKDMINEEEKAEATEEKVAEEDKEKMQHKFKKLFSMKKAKKEEDKTEEKDEEKKDEEKKEGEETIEEVAEADVSKTTAEKKTLMQKLMTIKRDLMANKKEEKAEEDVDGEKKEG